MIIIDIGNAVTVVEDLIFPDINLSKENLTKKASLIQETKIIKTKKIIANNTNNFIKSGFIEYIYLLLMVFLKNC